MKKVNRKLDFTWVVMGRKRFEQCLALLADPPTLGDADSVQRASYREYAEIHADAIRMAHHIPFLRKTPLTLAVFDFLRVDTETLGILEKGYDEFAITLWAQRQRTDADNARLQMLNDMFNRYDRRWIDPNRMKELEGDNV